MFPLAADENFNNTILRGLLRRLPDLDIVRVQDSPESMQEDTQVLQWAADQGRILLTHDFETMIGFANERIDANQPMPGVFVMRNPSQPGKLIDELALIVECSQPQEWDRQVIFLPM